MTAAGQLWHCPKICRVANVMCLYLEAIEWSKNFAASVRARWLDIAKAQGVDFNQLLVRLALERTLLRLGSRRTLIALRSRAHGLVNLRCDMSRRATRDAGLLGSGK